MFDVFKTPEFKKALRFYLEEVRNNKKHFLISMFSAIIWCFLVILHPYLIKRIVDDGIVASNQQVIIVFLFHKKLSFQDKKNMLFNISFLLTLKVNE